MTEIVNQVKKAGILTYHWADNVGAVLQAYALQRTIENLGFECYILNYYPHNIPQRNILIRGAKRFMAACGAYKRATKFRRFRDTRLKMTPFYDTSNLLSCAPSFDAYICGSDQVWNLKLNNKSTVYFLDFVPAGKRKISYAASMGAASEEMFQGFDIYNYLSSFDSLSVREESTREFLSARYGLKSETVLDPVFLRSREEWINDSQGINGLKNYILVYYMEYNDELMTYAKHLAEKTGFRLLYISGGSCKYKESGSLLKNIGPAEFLGLLANARYVCTNSFHGTAFSIIFRKQFVAAKHSKYNSRIDTLLKVLELEDRYLDSNALAEDASVGDIYGAATETILNHEINKSINFLAKSLGTRD